MSGERFLADSQQVDGADEVIDTLSRRETRIKCCGGSAEESDGEENSLFRDECQDKLEEIQEWFEGAKADMERIAVRQ